MKKLVGFISLLAILLVVLPGPFYRFNLLDLKPAFTTLRYGAYVGIVALVLLLIQVIFVRKNINWTATGISALFAIVAVGFPLSIMNKAKSVPPIHDISTDLNNPPKFVAIVALRTDAPNPVQYAGEETAQQQRDVYPELKSQKYLKSFDVIFNTVQSSVNDLGWEFVNADKSLGIIEATDTTGWFGFKDDVVIRIQSIGQETILDIRSKSRIGKSDLGKNAERIHLLIDHINNKLAEN